MFRGTMNTLMAEESTLAIKSLPLFNETDGLLHISFRLQLKRFELKTPYNNRYPSRHFRDLLASVTKNKGRVRRRRRRPKEFHLQRTLISNTGNQRVLPSDSTLLAVKCFND